MILVENFKLPYLVDFLSLPAYHATNELQGVE